MYMYMYMCICIYMYMYMYMYQVCNKDTCDFICEVEVNLGGLENINFQTFAN